MSGVLASAVEAISRPFVSLFEKTGIGMVSLAEAQRAQGGRVAMSTRVCRSSCSERVVDVPAEPVFAVCQV
jgi:hypothetical protein